MDIKSHVDQFLANNEPTRQELCKLEDVLDHAYCTKIIDSDTFYVYTKEIIQKYYKEMGRIFCKLPECV